MPDGASFGGRPTRAMESELILRSGSDDLLQTGDETVMPPETNHPSLVVRHFLRFQVGPPGSRLAEWMHRLYE